MSTQPNFRFDPASFRSDSSPFRPEAASDAGSATDGCIAIPAVHLEQLRNGRDILRRQSVAIGDLSKNLDSSFCDAVALLAYCSGSVVVTGIGKAGLIGRKLAATLSSTGTRAFFMHPAEAVHGDLGCLRTGDVVWILSNSGETDELIRLLPLLARQRIPILATTAKANCTLSRAAAVTLVIGSHAEVGQLGLAPTTSTLLMLGIGDAVAMVLSEHKGFTRKQFAEVHPAGTLGQQFLNVEDVMRSGDQLRLADDSQTVRSIFTQGRKTGRRTGAVMLTNSQGQLTGLFTDSDLVRLLERRCELDWDRPIHEVMTAAPKTVQPNDLLSVAINLLSKHHISELPVVNDAGMPVGLVDITDVIRLVPEEQPD